MNAICDLPFEKKSVIPVDPRTKLFLTITVSTIMMSGSVGSVMNYIRPCLAILPVCLLLFSKRWKAVANFSLTYFILFALEIEVLPLLSGFWNFLLGALVGIYTHILPGFVMGYYLIDTTTVSEFVAAMERMYIPQKIVIPVSVIFRFFPTVIEEYFSISDAMKMRGIATLRSPMKMLEYRVVPLMMCVVKIGEELSAAALTRGLGAPEKRTNICRIGFGVVDILLSVIAVFCWAAFLIW